MLERIKAYGQLAVGLVITIALAFLLYQSEQYGERKVTAKWNEDKLLRSDEARTGLIAYANRITEGDTQHAKDQIAINNLRDAAGRVHVEFPSSLCGAAQASKGADGSPGVFPNRVDQEFTKFQGRISELAARCDQLNIDAIALNAKL
jgi:hypothetical protein